MRKFDLNFFSNDSLLELVSESGLTDFGTVTARQAVSFIDFNDLTTSTAIGRLGPNLSQSFVMPTDVSALEGFENELMDVEFVPTDPGFGNQWFLRNTTAGQFDLNVEDVWDDYTGNGVLVTVIDSGFRTTHDDYDANYLTAQDYDYDQDDFVPSNDSHGTAVVGIIAAEQGNGLGGVGVAWNSDIRGYEGLSFADFNEQILDAAGLGDGVGNTNGDSFGGDIVSMSFGTSANVFIDNADVRAGITAMANASANGRGGLGQIHVKSSGNSRDGINSPNREEGVGELTDSSKYTVSVAALRQDGWVTDFSTPGANVHVSAFADNTSNNSSIYTTTSSSDTAFTSSFGGTSAAAPQVSGVIALMLEANPDLGWRDVHEILALSSRHTGSEVGTGANVGAPSGGGHEQTTKGATGTWQFNGADSQLQWNGGGLHHSNDYGFGMIDALAAVRLSETWDLQQTSANDEFLFINNLTAVGDTTPTFGAGNDWTTTIALADNFIIEHVTLELSATIDQLDEIEIFITSPNGTSIQLLADTGDTQAITLSNWDFGTPGFWGEEAVGTWTVNIVDEDGVGTTVTDIDLEFSGKTLSDDALFVFTNEFSDYDGLFGHVTSFGGGSTGIDTINAAAVTSNTTINLLTNSGTIDGVAITNSNIQRVYTGDGNDTIIGDAFSEYLNGGRGADTIVSGSAAETLIGGAGNDNITVGSNDDAQGGENDDTFTLLPGVITGATFDGDTGTDRLLLTEAGVVDISDASNQLTSIEEIEFEAGSSEAKTLIISAQELDSTVEVPANLRIDGNSNGVGAPDTLQIDWVGSMFSTIDWSGWIFQDWDDTIDVIDINMDGTNTTLTTTDQAEDIFGGAGNDVINAGGGNDIINAGADLDTVNAGDGDDTIIDTEFAGPGDVDSYDGGAGIDTLIADVGWAGSVTFNLLTGEQTVSGSLRDTYTSIENLTVGGAATVIGSNVANILTVNGSDANTIMGNGGDDIINAGGGNDTIDGGIGADTVNAGDGDDLVQDNDFVNFDVHDGGAGIDTIDYSGVAFSAGLVTIDLTVGMTTVSGGNTEAILNFENVEGSDGGETIIGTSGANVINGNGGDDIIDGGGGTDTIRGGDGNDTISSDLFVSDLFGDAGDDTFLMDGGGFVDNVDGGTGIDTLDLSGNTWVSGFIVNLSTMLYDYSTSFGPYDVISVENIIGSIGNDTIIGSTSNNVLNGGAGDDIIFGEVDADTNSIATASVNTVDGGDGNDTIFSSGQGTYLGGDGDDTMYAGLTAGGGTETMDGGAGIDTLDLSLLGGGALFAYNMDLSTGLTNFGGELFTSFENLIMGDSDNVVVGTSGDNIISTNGGNDTIDGGSGNDTIDGGDGNDTILGGLGIDTLNGGDGNDILQGGFSTDIVNGGAGDDIIQILNGEFSDDVDGGTGSDTLDLSARTDMGANVDLRAGTYTLQGPANTITGVEIIQGTQMADTLRGNSGSTLFGNDGDDTFVFGSGDGLPNFDGGLGSDTADFSSFTSIDFFVDLNAGGYRFGTTLPGAFSGTLISTENYIGNSGIDVVIGSSSVNNIMTGAGNDLLDGGDGGDALDGGSGVDTATYAASGAGVTVNLTTGIGVNGFAGGDTLSNIENLIGSAFDDILRGDAGTNDLQGGLGVDRLFGEDGDDFLFGNEGNDILFGGNGIDDLRGGDGNDTLRGDGGNDLMYGDNGNDTMRGGLNNDTMYGGLDDDVMYGDAGFDLMFGQAGNDILFGGGNDDIMEGGNGNDRLFGGAGNDDMEGGIGNDRLVGQNGNDLMLAGSGNDVLIGGNGLDEMWGGTGNDRFISQADADTIFFEDNFGTDIWNDFVDGEDLMDFTNHSTVNSFADLTITQTGAHVLIENGADSIRLLNTNLADIDATDFVF